MINCYQVQTHIEAAWVQRLKHKYVKPAFKLKSVLNMLQAPDSTFQRMTEI